MQLSALISALQALIAAEGEMTVRLQIQTVATDSVNMSVLGTAVSAAVLYQTGVAKQALITNAATP